MLFLRIVPLSLAVCAALGLAQDQRAIETLKRAQDAAGGVEALSAVKDKIITREIRAVGGGMSGRQVVKVILASAIRQESVVSFGSMTLSLVDGAGTLHGPKGPSPLRGPQLEQARGALFRVRESLLLADRSPNATLTYIEFNDDARPADILEVMDSRTRQSVRLWIDRAAGELFQTSYAGVALAGSRPLVERYSDFHSVNGVRTPFEISVFSGGTLLAEIHIEKVIHNTGLTKSELR